MRQVSLKLALGALAFALSGCGDAGGSAAERTASKGAGGVTIELPEPKVQIAPGEAEGGPPEAAPAAPPPAEATAAPPAPKAAEEVSKEAEAPAEAPKAEAPAPPKPEPEAATPAPARERAPMPLPDRVVASTIDRIGYPCGAVASSTRIEGAEGESAYRITCTSGRTYRASNKSGRFRFKEWGG